MTQGMLLNHIFFRRTAKGGIDYFRAGGRRRRSHDADGRVDSARAQGRRPPVEYGGVGTMSKSKLNGVDPQDVIDQYGADTARLFVMFAGSPEDSAVWSDAGVEGAHRFLRRLWTFAQAHADLRIAAGRSARATPRAAVKAARREIHLTLKQANYDYERIQYNTVVSAGDEDAERARRRARRRAGAAALAREGLSILLRVLYPVVPHIDCALWDDLGLRQRESATLLDAPWPRGRPGRARAGRDRARAAGQRQAARQAASCRRAPTARRIEARAAAAPKSRSTPPARR